MNTVISFFKRFWLPLVIASSGLMVGCISLIIVYANKNDTSQQERIANLEAALTKALEQAQKLAQPNGANETAAAHNKNIKRLTQLANKINQQKKMAQKNLVHEAATTNDQPATLSNQSSQKTKHDDLQQKTASDSTPDEIKPLDEQDIEALQTALDSIVKEMEQGAENPSIADANQESPDKKEQPTPSDTHDKNQNEGPVIIERESSSPTSAAQSMAHEKLINSIKTAVDEKITKKQAAATTTHCNALIAEKVRESVKTAIDKVL